LFCLFVVLFLENFTDPCGKFGWRYPGKAQPQQEQRYPATHSYLYPFLSLPIPISTHSYRCVPHFPVSKQWSVFEILTRTQTLMHAIAHEGCTYTVRESALKADLEKNPLPHPGLKPASVLRLAFQLDVLPIELFPVPRFCLPCVYSFTTVCLSDREPF